MTIYVTHSLKVFITASSNAPDFPEYVSVGFVDEVQVFHYDSNTQRIEFKQDWMNKMATEDPQDLAWGTQLLRNDQQMLKVNIVRLKKLFKQTGGVHHYQSITGCEWDDETGAVDGYFQFGYDGEDWISLDLKTLTWITHTPEAVGIKNEWDRDTVRNEYVKDFITAVFIDWLRKWLDYGKSALLRTELPWVSLLQKTPSSPVSCHATGFYPDSVMLFWRRDGEELHEDVNHGDLLHNHDGTFQMSVHLNLTSVKPEDWRRYDCVFQFSGVRDDIVTKLHRAVIKTNWVTSARV
ncbi:major histocompatibility complex class I-related gene protein-like [Diretmus argenteus]